MKTVYKHLPYFLITVLIFVSFIDTAISEELGIRVIFYMDTGLGNPIEITDCSAEVNVGQMVNCTVPSSLEFYNNHTRIVFKGWYENGVFISGSPTINITGRAEKILQEYTAKYQVQYLVELDVGYRVIREWKNRGSLVTYDILEVWNLREGVRRLFLKWIGDIENDEADIYVEKLTKPLKAKSVWKTQYYVKLLSEHPLSVESGWFNEDETISIKPVNPIIYMNEGETKIELEKFIVDYLDESYKDGEHHENSIDIEIKTPVIIEAIWKKSHHVLLESDYVKSILLDEWIKEGTRLEFKEIENEVKWMNGTKIVFERWMNEIFSSNYITGMVVDKPIKARAVWKVYYLVSVESEVPVKIEKVGWIEKGSHVRIDANPIEREIKRDFKVVFKEWIGSIISSNPIIDIPYLKEPVFIKAVWAKKYLIKVNSPDASNIEEEHWILENETYDILAPIHFKLDNYTRMVFKRWVGCNIAQDNICIITEVKAPLTVTAEYHMEKKVELLAVTLNNEILKEVNFILKHESGEVRKVSSISQVWMRTGEWIIENSTWNGFEVTSAKEFRIEEDSDPIVKIVVRIFETSFKINDYLGLPAKGAKIIVTTQDGRVLFEGETDENGLLENVGPLPPQDLTAYIMYRDYKLVKQFNLKSSSPIYLTVPLSWTSLQIMALAGILIGSLVVVLTIRTIRKRKEMPVEVSMIPEPVPQVVAEDDLFEEMEIKKAQTVTLEEVVKKLEMSGERVEEVLGELAEEIKKKKKEDL